jgi:hypothetical protein
LSVDEHVARDLDARRADGGDPGGAAAFHGAALSERLTRRRRLDGEGGLTPGEPLAPLPRRAGVDVHEARALVEPEAPEARRARRRFERLRIMVRHGDVEGGAVEMAGSDGPAHGAVVLGAAIGRADDQRLA